MSEFEKWFKARARNPDKITLKEAFEAGVFAQSQVPSVPDDNIRGSIRLLKRASGHLRWLKKDAYQWRNLNPKTMRAAELLHRDIDAMLAAAPSQEKNNGGI